MFQHGCHGSPLIQSIVLAVLLIGCSSQSGSVENAVRKVYREAELAGSRYRVRQAADGKIEKYSVGPTHEVYERWLFDFDDRNWRLGYQSSDHRQAIREYIVSGESVENWTQLVTSHFVVADGSFEAMTKAIMEAFKQRCPSSRVSVIDQFQDSVIMEWQSPRCVNEPSQHEIRRLTRVPNGVLSLAYAQKPLSIEADRRNLWLTVLRSARIAPEPLYTLGDGSTFRHPMAPNGIPFPGENRLAKVVLAGPFVQPGQSSDKRAHAHWAFELAMKARAARRITITDVTAREFRILVDEGRPTIEKGRFKAKSSDVLVSPATTSWIYDSESTTAIFRIEIQDDSGSIETLLQPAYIHALEKPKFRSVVDRINHANQGRLQ